MINTEIFSFYSRNNYTCFDQVLEDVNNLIKKNNIKREDIIEYRTKNWETEEDGTTMYHYKVIISWWK